MTPLDRRRFLQTTAVAACAACLPVVGCNKGEEADPGPLRVDLAHLPEGQRIREEVRGMPVEIVRQGQAVRVRSLLCTHQGCEVIWKPAEDVYFCPCHDGRFDADGRPIQGPPRRPLRELAVRLENGIAIVGETAEGRP